MNSVWNEKYTDEGKDYKIQKKFPSGQTVKLELEGETCNRTTYFNVYLTTAHKRKRIDDTFMQRNGKDGIKPLLWAKQELLNVEEMIKQDFPNKKNIIYVCWDDNKRRDAYIRGLSNVGYKLGNILGFKCLYKII